MCVLASPCHEGLLLSWVCAVQRGSYWSSVAPEHLKCGWSQWRCAISVKHKLDFRLCTQKNNIQYQGFIFDCILKWETFGYIDLNKICY